MVTSQDRFERAEEEQHAARAAAAKDRAGDKGSAGAFDGEQVAALLAASRTPQAEDVEDMLRKHTVGLVKLDDFRAIRDQLAREKAAEREALALNGSGSASGSSGERKKRAASTPVRRSVLSFGQDEEEEQEQEDGARTDTRIIREKRVRKDPTLETSFLRSQEEERQLRLEQAAAQQAAVEQKRQQRQQAIQLPVMMNGAEQETGVVQVLLGDSIERVLMRACERFGRIANTDPDRLMLCANNMIIPNYLELIHFVANDVRVQGELVFDLGLFEKVTAAADPHTSKFALSPEFRERALPKIVSAAWYQKNKHIWPTSLWQTYDTRKDYNAPEKPLSHADAGKRSFYRY